MHIMYCIALVTSPHMDASLSRGVNLFLTLYHTE